MDASDLIDQKFSQLPVRSLSL